MFQNTLRTDSVPIFMPSGPLVTHASRCALSKIPPTKLQWDCPIPERLLGDAQGSGADTHNFVQALWLQSSR